MEAAKRTAVELLKLAHQGDKSARDEMVSNNIGLVWSVVHKYKNRSLEPEDLFQIGSIGLIKAIDRFDLSFQVEFSTYAVPMIAGEIRRYLRDDGMIKVSRTLKENAWKISRAREEIEQTYGREARLSEVEEKTGLDREDIIQAMDASAQVESLYKPVYQEDGKEICLQDQLMGKEDKEQVLTKIVVEKGLRGLGEYERKLIVLRYFEDKTQSETARLMGLTQVQVSRLEKKVLLQMRNMVQ